MIRAFQPKRNPFLFRRIGMAVWLCLFATLGLVFGAVAAGAYILLAFVPVVWLFLFAPMAYGALVAYRKEQYELHEDHLVCLHGGLLSDGRTELDVRNITHVRLRLPWLRHRFFGIGDVRVESAGSASAEITFQSVIDPEKLYDEILEIMRNCGYSLKGGEVLHEESPGTLGALTDAVQVGFGGGLTVFFIVGIFAGAILDAGLGGGIGAAVVYGGLALCAVVILGLSLGAPVIRYMDLTRRTYTVEADQVRYTEGFLTRDNAVIPFENIADASATRTIWDQVLGLYDVRVSCQGSGSEIVFRRLAQGEAIKGAIATLVSNAGTRKRELEAKAVQALADAAGDSDAAGAAPAVKGRLVVPADQAWTATLKMNTARAVAGVTGALIVPPAWLLAVAMAAIRASKTEYRVGADTLAESYEFLGASHTEFAYDKVTGVQVSRTPFDGLFGTVSIEIWSIGAPKPLQINHVLADDVNLPALLRQCGIPASEDGGAVLPQSYGARAALISQAPGLLFVGVLALLLVLAAFVAGPLVLLLVPMLVVIPLFTFAWTWLRIQRQTFTLYPDHFEAQTGVWLRRHVYVRYADVKKVETVQIPLTQQGALQLYVAGEKVLQTQNGEVKVPNIIRVQFLHGIERLVDAMDHLSQGRIGVDQVAEFDAPEAPALLESHPAFANEVAVIALVGLFFPPLWLVIPVVIWQMKVRRFVLEGDRVVRRDGIFFKRATSVQYAKIDSLQQNQGALGKAFKNGQVTLLTAGSSTPDLNVANVPDFHEVYATIRKHYGGGGAPAQLPDGPS